MNVSQLEAAYAHVVERHEDVRLAVDLSNKGINPISNKHGKELEQLMVELAQLKRNLFNATEFLKENAKSPNDVLQIEDRAIFANVNTKLTTNVI